MKIRNQDQNAPRTATHPAFARLALVSLMAVSLSAWAAGPDFTEDVTITVESPDIELTDSDAGDADWEICVDSNGCNTIVGTGKAVSEGFHIGWDDETVDGLPFVIERGTADFLLFLDASEHVGINTNTPAYPLDIHNVLPEIRMNDTSASAGEAHLQMDGNLFVIEGNTQQDIFRMDTRSPASRLVIDSAGEVGIGTTSPSASLEVTSSAGTAQILVDENNGTLAPRTLFKLSNAGNTKFEIEETSTANTWAFTNSGFDFRVSLQGSGVVEFLVDNSGNASLEGTLTENSDINDKQAIMHIDEQLILDKVTQLPVTQWQYKDTAGVNHIGPMAQDFHAAFGLGATDTGISTIDTGGVALASIKALAERNTELASQVEQLAATVEALQSENATLRTQFESELASVKSMLVDLHQAQQAQAVLTQAN